MLVVGYSNVCMPVPMRANASVLGSRLMPPRTPLSAWVRALTAALILAWGSQGVGRAAEVPPPVPDTYPWAARLSGVYVAENGFEAVVRWKGGDKFTLGVRKGPEDNFSCMRPEFASTVAGQTAESDKFKLRPGEIDIFQSSCLEAKTRYRFSHTIAPIADPGEVCLEFGEERIESKLGPGVILKDVALANADLQNIDLTGAILCNVDLSGTNLTKAKLNYVLMAGGKLTEANLQHASLKHAVLKDVQMESSDFSGANLSSTDVFCGLETSEEEERDSIAPPLLRLPPKTINGTILRDATFLCDEWPDGSAADLNGMKIAVDAHMPARLLKAGMKREDKVTIRDEIFTYDEISEIAVAPRFSRERVTPSFKCAQAVLDAERAVCRVDELAALDSGLAWIWQGIRPTSADVADQRSWLGTRNACGGNTECIWESYSNRIIKLAPRVKQSVAPPGQSFTYFRTLPYAAATPTLKRWARLIYSEAEYFSFTQEGNLVEIDGYGKGYSGQNYCGFHSYTNYTLDGITIFIEGSTPNPASRNSKLKDLYIILTPQFVFFLGDTSMYCGAWASWPDVFYRSN